MQLIVVDQSPSHSEEVAAFLQEHGKEMRYLRLAEPNLPRARNVGIAEATGELILFVDDDIVLPRDAVSRLASHFEPLASRAIAGVAISERHPETSLKRYAHDYGRRVLSPTSNLIEVRYVVGALLCVPAEIVRRVGGFDEKLGRLTPTAFREDIDFCGRLHKAQVRLFLDPSLRVVHRNHAAGGCQSRRIDPELAARYHMRALAYALLKHHGRMGLIGWGRMLSRHVVNRKNLKVGVRRVLKRFSLARQAVAEAREFAAAEGVGPTNSD
jgi:GT2 family glycosyltransferase